MNELITKAKNQLQAGDIKTIANRSNIPYQTLYKVLNGSRSTRQTEILKAVTDFLQERKNEMERLESVLN
ncbi:hypothetical protein [Epilithonimonas tenax]|uniref:hypothetical protein n=1 Tax=Epilithonimonas tenax TaxID=191577 RepID=UPI00040C027D|nr:hypothetical protein [Epilithonimonas tenax]